MNDQQKKCFKLIYNFIHDERSNAQNLIALVDIRFPEIDSEVSRVLHENVKPYLETRRSLGAVTMELMYLLNQLIAEESMIE